MVVQHNLRAMNSNRMLGLTASVQSKSTEKLSSGYKINRAADDAAGLSISEKMRKQIRGLSQASLNASDGISAVQTAEGALNEVQDMLQRMNELAVKASNGTMSEDDRNYVQNEIDQLVTELDRVAETTKFNETYLLKGTDAAATKTLNAYDAGLAGKLGESVNGKTVFTANELEVGDKVTIGGKEYNIVDSPKTSDYTSIKEYTAAAGDVLVTADGKSYTYLDASKDKNGVTVATGDKGWYLDNDSTNGKASLTLAEGDILTTKTDGKVTTLVGSTSLTMDTAAVAVPTWAAGDTLVQDGKTYTYDATASKWKDEEGDVANITPAAGDKYTIKLTGKEGQLDNKGISTVQNIQDMIKTASDGDAIKIRHGADGTDKTYTVGVTTKEDGTKYTADDIAALVKEGDYVTDKNSKTYYAVAVESDNNSDISLKEAYAMMTDELAEANSIGADKEATVVNHGDGTFTITQGTVEVKEAITLNLHVGADADTTNKISISIDSMSAAGLGVKGLNVAGDLGVEATYAIDAITDAIQRVSTQRSALGAVQNRLEHTIANLDNVVENTTAAESQIRDTDMATEMVKYSNNNILAQAGQAMLAQANQANQGVLSLLG